MLRRRNDVAPQQEYYADSLLTLPTASQSVFHNLALGIATPIVALNMMDKDFAKKPDGQAILGAMNAIKLENETPGMSWSQWLAGEGANMLGFALNPATWVLGEAGGLAAKGLSSGVARLAPDVLSVFARSPIKNLVSEPIGRYIPEMIGKEGAEKPLSLSLLSEKTLENFGVFAGAGLPQGIVDNFKADTDHIEWGGVAREMGEMGAFGMAIGSVPFAWGVLRGKINRGLGKAANDVVDSRVLDQALEEGHITKTEHQWYTDYLEHQKDPGNIELSEKLKQSGSEIINANGHKANTVSNEAMFEIMTPDEMKNLQGVIADQLTGNVPEQYKKSLSDFVTHNALDGIRSKPEMLDGVRGYVDFINKKLEARGIKSAQADQTLDKHLMRGVKENMPFSQKELFKYMKQAGFEASHIAHLPVTIPENMVKHLKIAEKINKLKEKLKISKRKGMPENRQTMRRIEELESSLPKIMTPKEELSYLRNELLGKGLKKNFERSNAYHRLLDLSNVWHNARSLLDRVHLEHEYKRQEAFRDLANQVLKIADSDMTRISKPEDVVDYLKRRIEGNLVKLEPIADVKRVLDERQKVPSDADIILKEQSMEFDKSDAAEAKKEFVESTAKFGEFKESESIFKNLIGCVMGGLRG